MFFIIFHSFWLQALQNKEVWCRSVPAWKKHHSGKKHPQHPQLTSQENAKLVSCLGDLEVHGFSMWACPPTASHDFPRQSRGCLCQKFIQWHRFTILALARNDTCKKQTSLWIIREFCPSAKHGVFYSSSKNMSSSKTCWWWYKYNMLYIQRERERTCIYIQ